MPSSMAFRRNPRSTAGGHAARGLEGDDLFGGADGAPARPFGNPLDEPGQYLAGTDFIERGNSRRRHESDRLAPAHGSGHLRDQSADDLKRVASRGSQNV